jgi:hypothetical protein
MVGAKQQGRLDGFFKPMGTVSSAGGSKAKVKEEPKGKGGKRKVSLRYRVRLVRMERLLIIDRSRIAG